MKLSETRLLVYLFLWTTDRLQIIVQCFIHSRTGVFGVSCLLKIQLIYYIKVSGIASGNKLIIKVLCEQTREANKRIKMFFGLCLISFGFGNIVADFHVLFRVLGN